MRSPEVRLVAKKLASLALERHQQNGRLKVRQREQLRRTLVAAAEVLGWETLNTGNQDPVIEAAKDMAKLARNGTKALEQDLIDEVTVKKAETTTLKGVAKQLHKLSKDKKIEYPVEMSYEHTAKTPGQGLVTKTAELVLKEPGEAESAALDIEKRLPRWGDLKDEMLEELKRQQDQLDDMRSGLPGFVEAYRGLLAEVFAILH